ncbi:MAG: endolytic transglycosylase MltG [Desulfobacterales bacterium]|nr:endolytic transglycosylase MltG [Desulfobacterales bacterium]
MGKKKIAILILIFFIIGVFVCCLSALEIYSYSNRPASNEDKKSLINIYPGQSLNSIIADLIKIGAIESPFKFKLLARIKKADRKIKAGEYLLSTLMSPNEIIKKIVSGDIALYKLTIPEGYNLSQIALSVENAGFSSAREFLEAANDLNFIKEMKIPGDSFEGYLFPETYYFEKNVTPKQIISCMVKRFWEKFTPAFIERADNLGFSIHQIVTIASIIEKETGDESERPLISSVFHNRLKKKMRLESDPTVIYGIKDFNGNITKKDLAEPTPYNTYMMSGLPPGPIANPGFSSIEAALFPSNTDYIFFVSKNNKTHYFSNNIKDHNKAVIKYQKKKR